MTTRRSSSGIEVGEYPQERRLATACHPENQGMGNVAGVQVEKVGRAVVGFDDCQVLRAEVRVRLLAGKDRKEKRQVGVVRVQQYSLRRFSA